MSIHRHFYLYALSLSLLAPGPSAQAEDIRAADEAGGVYLVHGDFDWINKGRYRSASGEHCCGRDDCYEVAPERVQQNTEGYSLPDHNMTVPGQLAIPSEDGKYWICK